ncbi:MAG: CoA-binding protein [Longimicrobiales bacterium]
MTAVWRDKLIEDDDDVASLVRAARRIAVLGIKTEAQAGQPAFYVAEYLHAVGLEILPVPVYYPQARRILGRDVWRRVQDVPGPVDIVVVFRRSRDIPPHVPDLIAKRPRAVWFQSGIRHEDAAEALAREGMFVVQDRCLMIDHRRFAN